MMISSFTQRSPRYRIIAWCQGNDASANSSTPVPSPERRNRSKRPRTSMSHNTSSPTIPGPIIPFPINDTPAATYSTPIHTCERRAQRKLSSSTATAAAQ